VVAKEEVVVETAEEGVTVDEEMVTDLVQTVALETTETIEAIETIGK
tara:strand:+ start:74 stop:214 length:141 start_codon:yes stop_codon:yes gene_type:complete